MPLRAMFEAGARPVRAALIGAGEFGRTFVLQAQRIPGLQVLALCDRDPERAVAVYHSDGIPAERIAVCDSAAAAKTAFERGDRLVVSDGELLRGLALDAVIEATGDPEAGARNALAALDDGKHVVLVTKETDCAVGPILSQQARRYGLVCTPADGDQPSLLIGLVAWARGLGFEIVAGGKSSEYDCVYDPREATVRRLEGVVDAPAMAEAWQLPPDDIPRALDRRNELLAALPRRTVPDLCELTVVANHTGLKPDRPDLHAPVARTLELPDIFRPREDGGVLEGDGVVDMFNCLRRPDELSFAGGVFVVVHVPDRRTTALLAEKGIPVSNDDHFVMLHNPVHLLGMEAPVSLLSAVRLGRATGSAEVRPHTDVIARAEQTIAAGTVLSLAERHAIAGLAAEMAPASPITAGRPLPYYLAAGSRLRRDLAAGDVLTADMVEPPAGSVLWELRRQQDTHFALGGGAT